MEALLLSQLKDYEQQISELQAAKAATLRQLEKVRTSGSSSRDVTRRNSYRRILSERHVLDTLNASNGGLTTKRLVKEIRTVYPDMPEVTARVQLTRMRDKGLIQSPSRGKWVAVAAPEPLPF